jgi:diguanylate cyclase (GGDEF)-like protein
MTDRAEQARSTAEPLLGERLDLLVSGVTAACQAPTWDALVEAFAELSLPLCGADSASVSLMVPELDRVRTVVNVGRLASWEQRNPVDEFYDLADYPNLAGLIDGVGVWSASADAVLPDPREAAEVRLLTVGGRSASAAASVVFDQRLWAELYVARDRAPGFDQTDLALLRLVAMSLGTARSLFALAASGETDLDPLTGLARRGSVERALADRGEHPVVLALFDVDGLKAMNDEYGHAAGDRLLAATAAALVAHLGPLPGAVLARIGGDEFAAVVPGADVAAVVAAAHAAQHELAASSRGWMSCGVGSSLDLRDGGGSGKPLMRLVDATLYRAKRLRLAHPLRVEPTPLLASDAAGLGGEPDAEALAVLAPLQVSVGAICRAVDGAAWWVSRCAPGSSLLRTLAREVRRDRREEADDVHPVGEAYDVEQLPWTARALGGDSFWVGINDVAADPGELAMLAELGYTGSVVAGTTDATGARWLVEVFADPQTAPLDRFGPSLLDLLQRLVLHS